MINSEIVRRALRTRILASGIIDVGDVAWEGHSFDPKGKSLWLREKMLPVSGAPAAENCERLSALMRYDIFVPAATGTEAAGAFAKELGDLFNPDDNPLRGQGIDIIVTEVTPMDMRTDGPWSFMPIQITLMAYSA